MLVTMVKNALNNRRLAQSYLVIGRLDRNTREMINKTIKILGCKESNTRPCLSCQNCELIERRAWPGLFWWDERGETIGVDVIKMLKEFVCFSPSVADYKIVVITSVEKMTKEAANRFLKTLEEPLPNIVYILQTEGEFKLLPTIVSRCQKIFLGHKTKYDNLIEDIGDEIVNIVDDAEKLSLEDRIRLSEKLSSLNGKEVLALFFKNLEEKVRNIRLKDDVLKLVKQGKVLLNAERYFSPRINKMLWLENLLIQWGEDNG